MGFSGNDAISLFTSFIYLYSVKDLLFVVANIRCLLCVTWPDLARSLVRAEDIVEDIIGNYLW